jgi:predicted membrane-bound spermidine synthase
LVLREEPAKDDFQALVNAHTQEDGGHWNWFLADLASLGQDPRLPFSDALRFLWSERTTKLRMLSYGMCRLGLGASSLHKLVLVQCIEATAER